MLVLEETYKSKKAQFSDSFNLRIHRGLSWLKQAVLLDDALDLKFISLWISFNAIYAKDLHELKDRQQFRKFLSDICQADTEHKIYHLIWTKYSHAIRILLDNHYTFQPFWDFQNQKISQQDWKMSFEQDKIKVHRALQQKDSVEVLYIIFNRLYTLRNQIMHGSSTYKSSINRSQLQDSSNILTALLPIFMHILLENEKILDLGKPFYPVVQVS
ncbi:MULTISPECIES: HEPN domain-containing protein [unclassified Acinetobacter]|uniref:HEPN domain-containing protein n=1 Tax=unclassified Acinetobacter TaxID=196816 RepID=UPI0025758FA2|nr:MULTISPECIES: HEPN domain-containing protein [unclassified Acinetobacter]MDM1763888.1 hypothetical protein [Acinetobacter sp. 226-1]MDM1767622.1 hypothetical protein [Acinetobacter sp. 226-4]